MRWFVVFGFAVATGCGPGEATDSEEAIVCSAEPSAELGQGEITFEPVGEGGVFDVVHGPQGGFHVDAAVVVEGFGATVQVSGTVVDTVTGAQVGGAQADSVVALQGYDAQGCTGTAPGLRLFLDDLSTEAEQEAAACALGAGGALEVTVTVTDLQTSVSATVTTQGIGTLLAAGGSPCP